METSGRVKWACIVIASFGQQLAQLSWWSGGSTCQAERASDELIELSLLELGRLPHRQSLAGWLGASVSRPRWETKQEIIIRRWAAPWKWHRRCSVTPTSGASGVCQSSLSAAAADDDDDAGNVNISYRCYAWTHLSLFCDILSHTRTPSARLLN